jgi:hypothetical protein
MTLALEPWTAQQPHWPARGRHVLAQADADSIVVYQAYRPEIAEHAVAHERFGGEFSYARMSWIKPNFLWMMFRCGWATKPGQERVLAVRLARPFFDGLLAAAVPSGFVPEKYDSHDHWREAVAGSAVRLQWDPDHGPGGEPLERRAVQLGLRGDALRRYGQEALAIEDITDFVATQRAHATGDRAQLLVPRERVYAPSPAATANVGLDAHDG